MCWRSNRKSGSPSQKSGRRHISTSGLASSAPRTFLFSPYSGLYCRISSRMASLLPVTAGISRGGQVRSRDTTSGSHAVASSRIPRLRSRRVCGSSTTWRPTCKDINKLCHKNKPAQKQCSILCLKTNSNQP